MSGDGIFAGAVSALTRQGVNVTVAAHECALSLQLRMVASELVLLSRDSESGGPRSIGSRHR